MRLTALCPAKVNLFLAVGPPDERKYHPVRTILQAVGLADELTVEFGDGPLRVEIVGADLPAENTLTQALRLSREVFTSRPRLVRLVKRIPSEAGLGGGSSDAAALLRVLNSVQPASGPELASLAKLIGVDVPFFLVGGRARGEGYGDEVIPLPDAEPEWLLIAKPEIGCSTPGMYARLDRFPRDWRNWPDSDILYNDFERVAPPECLELISRLVALGARDAGLSGSGSAVFGRFASRDRAESAQSLMGSGWVTRTLSRGESLRID